MWEISCPLQEALWKLKAKDYCCRAPLNCEETKYYFIY